MAANCASAPAMKPASQEQGIHLDILGDIDDRTSIKVIEALAKAEKEKRDLVMTIDSNGGDFNASYAANKALRMSHVHSRCYVLNKALSGAFVILQGCRERISFRDSRLMIHAPAFSAADGCWKARVGLVEIKQMATRLELTTYMLAVTLATRWNKDVKEIREILSRGADWWFTPDQALAEGALDVILP